MNPDAKEELIEILLAWENTNPSDRDEHNMILEDPGDLAAEIWEWAEDYALITYLERKELRGAQ